MTVTRITNVNILRPGRDVVHGAITIIGDKIDRIEPLGVAESSSVATTTIIDGGGRLLSPGLIDVHTHGVGMNLYERGPEEILAGSLELPKYGVTCILPTLYRVMNRPSLAMLEKLAHALPLTRGARTPGFHLEGPFLKLPGAGCETIPGDLGLLAELYSACHGRVTSMSISPDTPNILPVIQWLVAKGIVPFVTHTRASPEETEAAIEAGARHGTHFYDVFPVPVETEPGVRPVGAVEALLADKRTTVDFIADGVHVHPTAIKAALAAKGFEGIVLITDSNIGAGLPAGIYNTSWGFPIKVSSGDAARIWDTKHAGHNCLAGSSLTMDQGIRNLHKWLKLPIEQIVAMGSSNPARLLRWPFRGVIEPGADADLVLWDDQHKPVRTWVGGETVFSI